MSSAPRLKRSGFNRTSVAAMIGNMRWGARVLLLASLATVVAFGDGPMVELTVDAKKRTTKTGEAGSVSSKTFRYVERTQLNVSLRGSGVAQEGEVAGYFVARNVQSQVLKYCGVEKQLVTFSATRQQVQLESQPVAYAQSKDRNSTRESKRGDVSFGWVVVVSAGGQEIAVRTSSPEILQWVRRNPPRHRGNVSP